MAELASGVSESTAWSVPTTGRPVFMGTNHVISAGHYLAAWAGLQMSEAGGNAIDAGVAAGLSLECVAVRYVQFGRRGTDHDLSGCHRQGPDYQRAGVVAGGDRHRGI